MVKAVFLQVRMDESELAAAHALAEARGTTASALVRSLLGSALLAERKRSQRAVREPQTPSPAPSVPPASEVVEAPVRTRGDRGRKGKRRR